MPSSLTNASTRIFSVNNKSDLLNSKYTLVSKSTSRGLSDEAVLVLEEFAAPLLEVAIFPLSPASDVLLFPTLAASSELPETSFPN